MKSTIKFLAGIALIAVIIFSMAACDNGGGTAGGGGGGGGGNTINTALNGTWIDDDDDEEMILDNGNFEVTGYAKGSYSINGNNMTMTITHVFGDAMMGVLESRWYTETELRTALKTSIGGYDEEIDDMVNKLFAPHTGTYSVIGDTLTMTMDGETSTYIKKGSSSGGGGTDSALNGTWVVGDDGEEMILNNGNYEISNDQKGTYTTKNNNMRITPTHIHGNNFPGYYLDSRWYTKAEIITALKQYYMGDPEVTDAQIEIYVDQLFAPETINYSLNGNTLTLAIDGESKSYTKQGSSGGSGTGTENDPFTLTSGTWTSGTINSDDVWYSFNVTGGTTYNVWWNDKYGGDDTKTADIIVSAYNSNGSPIFEEIDFGWYSPQSFTASSSGTVKLKVQKYDTYSGGNFAIVYSTSSTRPGSSGGGGSAPSTPTGVTALATSSSRITITWSSVSGATGYVVTSSSSPSGHYDYIGESTSTSYTDTELSANTTYYYIVFAYNDNGISSESSYVSATTLSSGSGSGTEDDPFTLTSGTWTDGSISNYDDVYYSFDVTSGTKYYVWWNDSYEGNHTKTADIYVTAYFNGSSTDIFNFEDSGWNSPQSFTASSNGKVILEAWSSGSGTFAIAYSTSSTRPGSSGGGVDKKADLKGVWVKDGGTNYEKIEYEGRGGSNDPIYFRTGSMGVAVYYDQLASYDGTTVITGDSHSSSSPITFTAVIEDGKLTVSGLSTVDGINLSNFNGTYTKE